MVSKISRLRQLVLRPKQARSVATHTGWHIFNASVQGARHKQASPPLPNQDKIVRWMRRPGELPLIVALSDGHGSSSRGEIGAAFAVEVALDVLRAFITSDLLEQSRSQIQDVAKERVTRELSRKWQERVFKHAQQIPLPNAAEDSKPELVLAAYGATMLVVALWVDLFPEGGREYTALYLQLGDGDILIVSEEGDVQWPLARNDRLLGNETTSLSSLTAWEQFQVRLEVYSSGVPALILVSSDGYANSYRDDVDFMKVGSDLLVLLRQEQLDSVADALPAWLEETSQAGSGDDISLGVICHMDGVLSSGLY